MGSAFASRQNAPVRRTHHSNRVGSVPIRDAKGTSRWERVVCSAAFSLGENANDNGAPISQTPTETFDRPAIGFGHRVRDEYGPQSGCRRHGPTRRMLRRWLGRTHSYARAVEGCSDIVCRLVLRGGRDCCGEGMARPRQSGTRRRARAGLLLLMRGAAHSWTLRAWLLRIDQDGQAASA